MGKPIILPISDAGQRPTVQPGVPELPLRDPFHDKTKPPSPAVSPQPASAPLFPDQSGAFDLDSLNGYGPPPESTGSKFVEVNLLLAMSFLDFRTPWRHVMHEKWFHFACKSPTAYALPGNNVGADYVNDFNTPGSAQVRPAYGNLPARVPYPDKVTLEDWGGDRHDVLLPVDLGSEKAWPVGEAEEDVGVARVDLCLGAAVLTRGCTPPRTLPHVGEFSTDVKEIQRQQLVIGSCLVAPALVLYALPAAASATAGWSWSETLVAAVNGARTLAEVF